jgi:recombination protein RecA
MYGQGISREGDLLDLAANENVLEKSGAWFSYGGERIGQGREQAKAFLREHPEITAQLEVKLLDKFGVRKAPPEAEKAPAHEPEERKPRVKAVK